MENQKYAGFGLRFLAYWVDFLILFPVSLIIQQMVGNSPFAVFQAQSVADLQKLQGSANSILGIAISIPLAIAYFLICWVNYDGATPGKKLLGIKITKANGEKMTYATAFMRWVGYLVSGMTIFFFAIGYLWIIWDKKRQALHDKIAGTVVVKTEAQPKTALAFLLTVVAILMISGYMMVAMIKGFTLGFKEAQQTKHQTITSQQNTVTTQLINSGNLKLQTANQLAGKKDLTQNEKDQITGLLQRAISDLKQAMENDPKNEDAWFYLGKTYSAMIGVAQNSDQWAIDSFQKGLALNPQSSRNYFELGGIYSRLGQYDNAVKNFQMFVQLEPSNANGYYNLGYAYKKTGALNEAKKAFTKALELLPQNSNDRYMIDKELQGL